MAPASVPWLNRAFNWSYYIILYYIILYYIILHYTTLNYTILFCTILYHIKLYYTILYYTILYYTILYYTILYCTILCQLRAWAHDAPCAEGLRAVVYSRLVALVSLPIYSGIVWH